jgi:amiloride-sensitive sodium channel
MDFGSFDEFQEIVDDGYNGSMDHLNITEIYEFMMFDCADFIVECRWRKKVFDCCKLFTKQKTEYGICWSFNSLSSEGNAGNNLSLNNFPWRVHLAGRRTALEVI